MILIRFVLHWSLIFAFVELSSFAETPSARIDSAIFSSKPLACKEGLQWQVEYQTCPHPTHTPIYIKGKGEVCGVESEIFKESSDCGRAGYKECRHPNHGVEQWVPYGDTETAYYGNHLSPWYWIANDGDGGIEECRTWCKETSTIRSRVLREGMKVGTDKNFATNYECIAISQKKSFKPGKDSRGRTIGSAYDNTYFTCEIHMHAFKPQYKLATSEACGPKFNSCLVKEGGWCRHEEFGVEDFEKVAGPECGIESVSLFSDIEKKSVTEKIGGIRFNDDVETFRKSLYGTPLSEILSPYFSEEDVTVKITEPGSHCLLCNQLENPMERTICLLNNLASLHDLIKSSKSKLKSQGIQSALGHINEELTFAIRELVGVPDKFANFIGECAKTPANSTCKHFFAQMALSARNDKKFSLLSNIGLRLLGKIGSTGSISDVNNDIFLLKIIFGEKLFDLHTIDFDLIGEIRLRLKSFEPDVKTSGDSKYIYIAFLMSDFYARAVEKYVSQRSYEVLNLKSLLAKLKTDQLSVKDVLNNALSEIDKMDFKPQIQSSIVESLVRAREGKVQEMDSILSDTVALIKVDIKVTLSEAEKLLGGLAAKNKLLEGTLAYLDLINGSYNQALLKFKESRISFRQDRDLPIDDQNEMFNWMFANFLAKLDIRISESSKLFETLRTAKGPVFDMATLALDSESAISAQLLEVLFQANINFNESLNAVRLQVLRQIDGSMISSQIELKNELEKLR
ncbi:MAG: hypothetical protein IPL83_11190 [Bdellovibrionales bacterium]|nr:hypothetical protein [Bdellovibrionales bacterium]